MDGSVLLRVPVLEEGADEEDEEDDEEDEAFKVHLIPRSSPIPRRRNRSWDEAEDPSLTRKVRFADTCGLDLVHLQTFSKFEPEEGEGEGLDSPPQPGGFQFQLQPDFSLPSSPAELWARLQEQGVEVEAIARQEDLLSVVGTVRVLNDAFQKSVQVRATLDSWRSHYDHPAGHLQTAPDGGSDLFSFTLHFPQSCAAPGACMEFVVRYQTPGEVRWANNRGSNYRLICRALEEVPSSCPCPNPSPTSTKLVLRSCLRASPIRRDQRELD
ncbi:protein phosphatase 1 regulatory subunit 3A-like [Leucoraja erinacea]|uniref:protein phosphatase 1 regulatory subunit 3A-like n=1 Tax=Leucoraja erinaceus TaxID=7782 RepID=UPI0024549700|nr:protein phosphatase 1 regulatory subunit 3A-like [Leucoraja erinacea]